MADSKQSRCGLCGRQTVLVEEASGNWIPFEVDRSRKHNCMHNTPSKCGPSRACSTPIELNGSGDPIDGTSVPFWICVVGFVLFVAVNLVWLQAI
ncbi:MAG: hypothetical protein Rhob2KO_42890 [Rhodopirellula baltica]